MSDIEQQAQSLRLLEAVLFASSEPVSQTELLSYLPENVDIEQLLVTLQDAYKNRGITLVQRDQRWAMRTAPDLGFLLQRNSVEQKTLSRAAMETLSIIAYHQPVTRAEIEEVRGVSTSGGTIDLLMETAWIRMRGRRRTPGRPITYGTTPDFLDHFGLTSLDDLPGIDELKGAGLLTGNLPRGFSIPSPSDELLSDAEDPLEDDSDGRDDLISDDPDIFNDANVEPLVDLD